MITFVSLWKKIRVEEKRGEIKRINCEKGRRTYKDVHIKEEEKGRKVEEKG